MDEAERLRRQTLEEVKQKLRENLQQIQCVEDMFSYCHSDTLMEGHCYQLMALMAYRRHLLEYARSFVPNPTAKALQIPYCEKEEQLLG